MAKEREGGGRVRKRERVRDREREWWKERGDAIEERKGGSRRYRDRHRDRGTWKETDRQAGRHANRQPVWQTD